MIDVGGAARFSGFVIQLDDRDERSHGCQIPVAGCDEPS